MAISIGLLLKQRSERSAIQAPGKNFFRYLREAKMYLDLAQHDRQQDYYKSAWNVLEQSTRIHAVSERCMIETGIYQTTAALGLYDPRDAQRDCGNVLSR